MGISDNHVELRLIRGRLEGFKRHFAWSGGHFNHVEMLEGFMGLSGGGEAATSASLLTSVAPLEHRGQPHDSCAHHCKYQTQQEQTAAEIHRFFTQSGRS